ncbi:MAG: CheR family methyltransferase [Clostridium sp.]|uniref:CheR family methyltransferase n=1 Tax=Clostridium sp. TaxID=1506 RepID=UPI003F2A9517
MENDVLYKWVYKELKIDLYCYKQAQINRRITSLALRRNCSDKNEYFNILKYDIEERERFKDFITINVTEFYRNQELFKELESVIYENIKINKRPLKVWSAACSNGCEAYTLSIMLNEIDNKINHSIIASDIDTNILNKGRSGIYSKEEVKNISKEMIAKYFIIKENKYYIDRKIKRKVLFKELDLIKDEYEKNFDLIVCRNVIIYFNSETKKDIFRKLSNSLREGGLLFIGATESIYNYREYGLCKVSTFIYKKK